MLVPNSIDMHSLDREREFLSGFQTLRQLVSLCLFAYSCGVITKPIVVFGLSQSLTQHQPIYTDTFCVGRYTMFQQQKEHVLLMSIVTQMIPKVAAEHTCQRCVCKKKSLHKQGTFTNEAFRAETIKVGKIPKAKCKNKCESSRAQYAVLCRQSYPFFNYTSSTYFLQSSKSKSFFCTDLLFLCLPLQPLLEVVLNKRDFVLGVYGSQLHTHVSCFLCSEVCQNMAFVLLFQPFGRFSGFLPSHIAEHTIRSLKPPCGY